MWRKREKETNVSNIFFGDDFFPMMRSKMEKKFPGNWILPKRGETNQIIFGEVISTNSTKDRIARYKLNLGLYIGPYSFANGRKNY